MTIDVTTTAQIHRPEPSTKTVNVTFADTLTIEERKSVYDHFDPQEIEPNFDTKAEAYEAGRGNGFEDGNEYGHGEGMVDGEQTGRASLWAEIKGMAATHTIAEIIEQMERSDADLREVEPAVVN